jgi:hypothetical protein
MMGEIVVKHFKRSGVGSDDKELITEIVTENSDTGRFLKRMEESRLTQPCFQNHRHAWTCGRRVSSLHVQ